MRVSLVAFGPEQYQRTIHLDGSEVSAIYADLTAPGGAGKLDLTTAARLPQNLDAAFVGGMKKGPFDVSGALARSWLRLPANPNGSRGGR